MLKAEFPGLVRRKFEAVRVQHRARRLLQQDFLDLCPPVVREVELVDVLGDFRLVEKAPDGEFGCEAAGGCPAADQ